MTDNEHVGMALQRQKAQCGQGRKVQRGAWAETEGVSWNARTHQRSRK